MTRRRARHLFERYLIVDWSAANAPARGANSIWIAEVERRARGVRRKPPVNPPTRAAAMEVVRTAIETSRADGARLFAGFDFPFGYPRGAVADLAGARGWRSLWKKLAADIRDDDDNSSNRFEFAAAENERLRAPRFWGRPVRHESEWLPAKKPPAEDYRGKEWRLVERWRPPAKSVWQLAYNGAAGSQALLGIARLEALRRDIGDALRIWPFETQFDAALDADIVIAEVYPSIYSTPARAGEVKDSAQARGVAAHFAKLDSEGAFRPLLARPPGLGDEDAAAVLAEEGWIVGVLERKGRS